MVTDDKPSVVVVGGGVIGICVAYFLALRGAQVTVLERDDIGKGASYGNAGTVAPGHVPINKPGRIRQAVKSLFDPLSPFYIAPRWDPGLVRWLWAFSRSCSKAHLEQSMGVLAPLGHATTVLFDELITQEGLACYYRRNGFYEVYLTGAALGVGQQEALLLQGHGYRPEVLDAPALRKREPALNERIIGGIFYPEAATLNPYRFVVELAERAGRHGVSFRTGAEVVEFLIEGGRLNGVRTREGARVIADRVVLATGAYSAVLARQLGYRLPLQAAKGYHIDRVLRDGAAPQLSQACVLGEPSVFCTPMDGFVRFAGTLEFSGINHVIRRPRLEQLTRAAIRYFQGVGEAKVLSEWCGLRPCLPDGLPVIGPLPRHPEVVIATGHAMMGLTLGPVTGKLVAEYILDGRPSLDLHMLRPERF